jgi:hypothetical protein
MKEIGLRMWMSLPNEGKKHEGKITEKVHNA